MFCQFLLVWIGGVVLLGLLKVLSIICCGKVSGGFWVDGFVCVFSILNVKCQFGVLFWFSVVLGSELIWLFSSRLCFFQVLGSVLLRCSWVCLVFSVKVSSSVVSGKVCCQLVRVVVSVSSSSVYLSGFGRCLQCCSSVNLSSQLSVSVRVNLRCRWGGWGGVCSKWGFFVWCRMCVDLFQLLGL